MSDTPEGKIQKKILDHLIKKGVLCWRNNNAPTWDQKLNSGYGGYRTNNVMAGVADILGIMPDGSGRFLAIEVKTPRGQQSAQQLLFQKRVERAGGVYVLARQISDVDVVLPQ